MGEQLSDKTTMNDHDLLVVLHTQMQRVLMDIGELRDNTMKRITSLENDVVYKKDAEILAEDQETRLRALEKGQTQTMTWGAALIVGVNIAEFLALHFVK